MITARSQEKELMDLDTSYYSEEEYQQCLKKLFKVSKLLGFFRDTVKILKKLPNNITIVDIGCGGGLFLLNLSKLFPKMNMLGLDICPQAIATAQQILESWKKKQANISVSFQLQQQEYPFVAKNMDVIVTTLVCHHMSDDEIILFLQQSLWLANELVIINDLHRHRIAEWLFRLISPFFRNRLISHDGLISIRRGFSRHELKLLLKLAGIHEYQIKWRFPFRWQIILRARV